MRKEETKVEEQVTEMRELFRVSPAHKHHHTRLIYFEHVHEYTFLEALLLAQGSKCRELFIFSSSVYKAYKNLIALLKLHSVI